MSRENSHGQVNVLFRGEKGGGEFSNFLVQPRGSVLQALLSEANKNKPLISLFAAADQSRVMQEQMTGAAMAMPADTNKAFKVQYFHLHSLLLSPCQPREALWLPVPKIRGDNWWGVIQVAPDLAALQHTEANLIRQV